MRARWSRLVVVGLTAAALSGCLPPGAEGTPPRMLFVGDSTVGSLHPALASYLATRGHPYDAVIYPACATVGGLTVDPAGNPLPDAGPPDPWSSVRACAENVPPAHLAGLRRHRPHLVVEHSLGEINGRIVDGTGTIWQIGTPQGDAKYLDVLFQEVRSRLNSTGAHLVILIPPPNAPPADVPAVNAKLLHLGNLWRQFADRHPKRVSVVEFGELICPGSTGGAPCPAQRDGITLRPDGFHYSGAGAQWAVERLIPLILAECRSRPRGWVCDR